jgi:hypothetical protein
VAFSGGKKTPPLNVPSDTSSHVTQGNITAPNPDTSHKANSTVPSGTPTHTRTNPNPTTPTSGGSTLDAAALQAIGDRLADMTSAQAIIDSGTLIYNAPAARDADRAYAACAIATAYEGRRDHASAVQWANKGLQKNPNLSSCRSIVGGP